MLKFKPNNRKECEWRARREDILVPLDNMKIGLIDADSHNFPNIPLMKISGWYKSREISVEFADENKEYDTVYVSKVFTESKEPELPNCKKIIRGGSGYDLINKLPSVIEHTYPDYSMYPKLTRNVAFGMMTRGCPRANHGFCITPKKDGSRTIKTADLSEFWRGQKNIVLLDQNILAYPDSKELLYQLADSGATIEFNGGLDVRYMTPEMVELIKQIKVKDYHFAWDDPREDLRKQFHGIKKSGIKSTNSIGVYVLTNYWSSIDEDLYRVYTLREMGFMPFTMIYDKQKFVDAAGRWHKGIEKLYTVERL